MIYLFLPHVSTRTKCNPIYVRWQRVKIMFGARVEGPYSFHACKGACANDEDPVKSDNEIQCSGFNHRQGLPQYSQHCQLYQADQLQHGESFFEADDRYSFYWEYCVSSNKSCSGDYAFTYLSDRYMDLREVHEVIRTKTLEDCLSECLNAAGFACRSVSYNRTDDSFTFDYECKDDGIQVKVISKYPYTGAMYGLYDFFTCRIEPKDDTKFEYFFPSPTISKNCSDSIRYKGRDMVLEIVISTDGVEPLYFITPDDLTYQARCPLNEAKRLSQNTDHISSMKSDGTDDNFEMVATPQTLFSMLANATEHRFSAHINQSLSVQQHAVATTTTATTTTTPITTPATIVIADTDTPATAISTTTTTATTIQAIIPATTTASATTNVTPVKATEWKPNSVAGDEYDENRRSAIIYQKSSTNANFAIYPSSSTNEIISQEIIDSKRFEKFSKILTTGPSAIQPAVTFVRNVTSENSGIFSEMERLNNITTTATVRRLNASRDVTLNEIEPQCLQIHMPPLHWFPEVAVPSQARHLLKIVVQPAPPPPPNHFQSLMQVMKLTISNHCKYNTMMALTNASDMMEIIASTTASTEIESVASVTLSDTDNAKTPSSLSSSSSSSSATLQVPLSTTVAGKDANDASTETAATNATKSSNSVSKERSNVNGTERATKNAVIFDIFHNGQPVEAVVVGSKITLSFIPYYAIPPIYMSIKGCQVEPIGSLYEWEREPLAIIKDGCQADHVGLVCPPERTEYGIRVVAESFRYQTTSQVQYSCLVRICPFAPCPMETCEEVEGCGSSNLLSNTFGLRSKRHITIEEIRAALAANPDLQRQIRLMNQFGTQSQTTSETQQQLTELGGDHIVKKQLVVVNSEDELRYYVRTGDVP
ncbi:unnamed protein product [Litomosoides sigmodontis]|uniref:ZP domain-containing protein n=1 Tax=Litomosoides sigmodontis TaxID=42156 RepID=A0A3P6V4Q9_LITSI|nr:unnamed protein product [Litomosoides sigmodontis]